MKSNSRVLRGWRDFGVKATAIILTILLATQMVGTPAFASGALTNKQASEDIATTVDDTGVEPSGTEATDTTVPDEAAGAPNEPAPADSTQATEEPVVETVESATEPATETPAADPAANTVLGTESEPAPDSGSEPAPAVEQDQLASIKLNLADGASITLSKDGNKIDDDTNPVKVPANEELKFTAQAAEGWQVDKVKTVIDGVETELTADANGEYKIAADEVTDKLTVKVEAEAVPEPETPAEEETTETDATVTDDTTVEDEETTPEATPNSVQSVDNSISLMAATGNGILGGSGTEWDPYEVTAGSSVTITEDYKSDRAKWSISDGTQYGRLSNTSIGSKGRWTWDGYQEGEDARATLTINDNAKVDSKITVRFGYSGRFDSDYEYTYFEVVAQPVSANSIDVSIDQDSIMVGETAQATATVEPSNAGYTWNSSNTSVASVDSNGRVTAKGIGTATISATTSNGLSDSVRITVTRNTNNDVEQTTHFYVAYPGVDDPDAGTWNPGNWLYAGEGKANLPLASKTSGGTIITGDLDSLVTSAPTYYKDKTITVDGVAYKWDEDGTRQPGTFTVVWDRAKCADGWNNSHMWDNENKVDEPHQSGTNV